MTARLQLLAPSFMPDFAPPGVDLACREPGVDPEVFFPLPHDPGAQAKAICRTCPAVVECGDWATWHKVDEGVWGGLSPEQRKARRRTPELVS